MSWNAKYALLLAFSTLVTWVSGLLIGRITSQQAESEMGGGLPNLLKKQLQFRKKCVVAASLIINLGILAFFKYYDFVLHNINVALAVFSLEPFEKPFDLLLPVGISFYTFQALSYTIDVYRGDVPAEKNPIRYALFVSFFPQLVAGPIERSKNLLRQIDDIEKLRLWNLDRVTRGLILMVWGYFLKMVIADRAAVFVNTIYNEYWMYGSCELSIATMLFAVQILCDFAGYSTIAIGAAKVMGFELMENFNAPYFATSIQDFWRRWHISLSTWFRDYLYFPLGGSRCSKARHYRNIMIVFAVSGLWHGASWTFVVWGLLHGAYQVIGIATKSIRDELWKKLAVRTDAFSWILGKVIITFVLVNLAWVFFRASTLEQAFEILAAILTDWNPWVLFDDSLFKSGLSLVEFRVLIIAIVIMGLADVVKLVKGQTIDEFLMNQNMWFKWVVMIGLICAVLVFGWYGPGFDPQQFIYFQF